MQQTDTDPSTAWASMRPAAHQKWNRLTEADLERIDGDAEALADCLRQRYGFSTERSRQEALDFCSPGAEGSGGQAGPSPLSRRPAVC